MLMIFISFFSDENDGDDDDVVVISFACMNIVVVVVKTYNQNNEVIRGRRHNSPVQAPVATVVANWNWSSNTA